MRFLVLAGVALLALAEVQAMYNYHETVGIAEATRIKSKEDEVMSRRARTIEMEDTETLEARIVGGAVAPTNLYPYLSGLLISFWNIAGISACGSSLISTTRLVTAAHCWFDGANQAREFEVVLGSEFLFYYGTRITTSQVITHPQYNPSLIMNDVAIISLPYAVALSASIQPVYLPSPSQLSDTFAQQWAYAAGYGKTTDLQVGVSTDTTTRHVQLRVIPNSECYQTFGSYIVASTICTSGSGFVGVCGGDSGGPLVIKQGGRDVLIGITSFVAQNMCHMGYPAAFARVTSFYTFIAQNL